jgi:hypothetical protein
LIQDPRWIKIQDPDPGSGNRNEKHGLYLLELRNHFVGLKILKFFDAAPGRKYFGCRMEKSQIWDPINILDPQNSWILILIHIHI